jgi:hypothetical protein
LSILQIIDNNINYSIISEKREDIKQSKDEIKKAIPLIFGLQP